MTTCQEQHARSGRIPAPEGGEARAPGAGTPSTHLRELSLDGAQSSLRQLGQFRVPNGVDGGGSVLVGQRLHLHTQPRSGEAEGTRAGGRTAPGLTTPIRSPRPYSPISSFLPSSFMMTERSRPLSTMKVLSDFSFCLQAQESYSGCSAAGGRPRAGPYL